MVARNHRIARRVVSVASSVALALSLCPFGQAFAIEPGEGQPSELTDEVIAVDAKTASEVYVSNSGSDENGNGSEEQPYASLSKAVDEAPDEATVYVMSDLSMSSCARLVDKDLTIKSVEGQQFTVSRASDFNTISDNRRSHYNPAMFEVTMPKSPSSLRIENLIIDDCGAREGNRFIPAEGNGSTNGVNNTDIVQDGIISLYSLTGTEGEVVLGSGAVLRDFGGMSAVNVSGGKLTMESGSLIEDDKVTDRAKEVVEDYGAAGAVWCRGGSLEMAFGSTIDGVRGRALYVDNGGNAVVNGAISGSDCDTDMWQGTAGAAVHVRGGSDVTLGGTGTIFGISEGQCAENDVPRAIEADSANFTADAGSVIKQCENVMVLHASSAGDDYEHRIQIDGEISDNSCGSNSLARSFYGLIVIGQSGTISGNTTTSAGGLLYSNNGSHYIVRGQITDNIALLSSMLYVANFSGGTSEASIEEGALISGNNGLGVRVNNGTTVTMNGGVISDNDGGNVRVSGKADYANAHFVMNGGTISSSTAPFNIEFTATNGAKCDLNGGVISSSSDCPSIVIIGGNSQSETERLSIAPGVLQDNRTVRFSTSMPNAAMEVSGPVKLGTGRNECESFAKQEFEGLGQVRGSFWYQSSNDSVDVRISDLKFDKEQPLYAAMVPTGNDGKPEGSTLTLYSVSAESDGSFSLSLPGQNAGGYTVVFLQQTPESPNPKVVTVTPADITVYEGGGGYSAVVGGEGTVVSENSMPHPIFRIAGIEDTSGLTFANESQGKSWTAISDGGGYYHFEPYQGQDQVRVTYTNADGKTVVSDEFDVSAVNETFAQFSVSLYLGDNNVADITASKGENEYAVALSTGTLTVRAVQSDPDDAVVNVSKTAPSQPLASGTAMAVEPAGTTYALNDTNVLLPEGAAPSLLFDDIIDVDANRTEALLTALKKQGSIGNDVSSQAKYLDLVDANNSNAWITASAGTDVYWGYPEGTDENTEFALYHFKGLHRDGSNSGYDVDDIASAEIEPVRIDKTDQGIKFHVDAGGFSPFVLTWETSGGGSVTPPQPQTVTLHYETNGGRPLADETHVLGAKVDLKTPLREGCTFAGWYLDETLTKPAEDPLAMDADKTVWAKWESTAVPGGFTSDHVNYVLGRDTDQGRLIMPESNITRAEAAAMFYRLLDEGTRAEYYRESSTFPDVEPGAWYEPAVGTLQAMGILRGDDGVGTVRPDDPITRAELAAMAGRFDDDGEWPDMEPFADMDGHWAERIVLVAAENGWVLGVEGSDKFRPDDPITRAETMAIANRVLQRLPEDESDLIAGRVQWPDNQDKEKWYWLAVEEATNNHDHTLKSDGVHERWTALLENEDWGE